MERRSRSFSITRLLIFLSTVALTILTAYTLPDIFYWLTIGLGLIVFNIVAYYHRRLERNAKRHRIWLQIKTAQLARMQLDWPAIPDPLDQPPERDHPFEADLDITGLKSLHHLLDLAITYEGSEHLKNWLLATTPQLEVVHERQKRIQELAPMSRFRDKLLLNFTEVSNEPLEGKKILNWLRQPPPGIRRWLLPVFTFLALLNLALFTLNHLNLMPEYWTMTFFVYVALYFWYAENLNSIFSDAIFLEDELGKLKTILLYLESYPYGTNHSLAELCRIFTDSTQRPSAQLKKINAIAAAVGLRMNPLMRIVANAALPWDWYCAYFLNRQKTKLAEVLPQWLEVCFELEALNSLANFAYLNPEYVFPKIIASADEHFRTQNIGHPLIPGEQRIANDFELCKTGELVIITGSNMSGKSTFLKTLGINLSLAYAGGPVCAGQLQTSLFRLFTCINVSDSVTEGFSFFFAEVRRLKALLNALQKEHAYPLFFLIDEIFKGTNNRERLIGSRSYIRALAGQNGIGAISTHDLELTTLASALPNLHNYHFREEVIDGQMVFDYKLHDGPCPTTNALKIMQLAGLPVEP
jgi:MutS domain V